MWELMRDVVATDSSDQMYLDDVVERLVQSESIGADVLDLGCGSGNSVDLFRRILKEVRWTGVDIGSSPEVQRRTRTDARFETFDGQHLPFEDEAFDLVFSRQVLEHVRYPEKLLAEVRRVLRTGGFFVGSTSYLEPFHSFSYWNFTPWGFRRIAEDAGFRMVRIYPGIDSITLIARFFWIGKKKFFNRFWREESPLNRYMSFQRRRHREPAEKTNIRKLQYCGQFVFVLQPA